MPDSRSLNGLELLDALARLDLRDEVYVSGHPVFGVDRQGHGIELIAPDVWSQDELNDDEDLQQAKLAAADRAKVRVEETRDRYLKALESVTHELAPIVEALDRHAQRPEIHMGVHRILQLVEKAIGNLDDEIPF